MNDSEFKGRQLKVTSKRVNQPGFYFQQQAAAVAADPASYGGRGYRGGRGRGPPMHARGRGGRGPYFPRGGGGGRGSAFRGGGRSGGYKYHPYY